MDNQPFLMPTGSDTANYTMLFCITCCLPRQYHEFTTSDSNQIFTECYSCRNPMNACLPVALFSLYGKVYKACNPCREKINERNRKRAAVARLDEPVPSRGRKENVPVTGVNDLDIDPEVGYEQVGDISLHLPNDLNKLGPQYDADYVASKHCTDGIVQPEVSACFVREDSDLNLTPCQICCEVGVTFKITRFIPKGPSYPPDTELLACSHYKNEMKKGEQHLWLDGMKVHRFSSENGMDPGVIPEDLKALGPLKEIESTQWK
ncbi:hypothetical protein BJ508DRAFT_311187 [Ascobolus immersus RN42]|uniref:Uncharacterized protein n=1 Tax=Ascobolus immersus RN42 TaxID=1160509 RepID=A0A3N4HTC5_ASCIM|nr:hypothetical protein BJ508DRAFT_311187 [Ascobolus immersus RN42]